MAAGQLNFVHPCTDAWEFQSPTTKPSKPILPLRTPVSSGSLADIRTPCQLENDAITVCAPAASAAG